MTEIKKVTAAEIAAAEGRGISAIAKRWRSNFPGKPFSAYAELSEEEIAKVSSRKAKAKKKETITNPAGPKTEEKSVPPAKKSKWVVPALYFVLIASTIASVYNLLRVSFEIADMLSAIVLTVVLSVAAVVFVASGIKHSFTRVLVAFLIAFEAVCNMVRIYGGLTRWEMELPTPFLATLTAVFHTGTYATATAVGAITAILIAGVQYASIFEINKHA